MALAGALCGCNGAAPSDGEPAATATMLSQDRIDVAGSHGRYTATRGSAPVTIDFEVPADRLAPEVAHLGGLVGETPDGVVVWQDDYASRPAGDRCRDGLESFVRVFSLTRTTAADGGAGGKLS